MLSIKQDWINLLSSTISNYNFLKNFIMKIAIENMSYSSLDNWIRKMYRDYQVELIYLQFEMSIFLKSMVSLSTFTH